MSFYKTVSFMSKEVYYMSDIVQAIASVGFPIVCCLITFWYLRYVTDEFRKEIKEIQDKREDDNERIVEALNNNTLVIAKITTKLDTIMELNKISDKDIS